MRYSFTQTYIEESMLWCSELIKHSLINYMIETFEKLDAWKIWWYKYLKFLVQWKISGKNRRNLFYNKMQENV